MQKTIIAIRVAEENKIFLGSKDRFRINVDLLQKTASKEFLKETLYKEQNVFYEYSEEYLPCEGNVEFLIEHFINRVFLIFYSESEPLVLFNNLNIHVEVEYIDDNNPGFHLNKLIVNKLAKLKANFDCSISRIA
ncbi:hypothetical protein COR50_14250 [Chitinophaga caeni]|uniref:Uncharacterized protein n=1 Tax=Chitinophaga caeni TaxID=2029983 RepID=A0A291QW98_9BACT|nr:hypothetical protein [Chitinophaga caeni]ATL48201.1 hypothetical protein COR50_14090 [Chitinophaga caeni]ATL48231.1 hypothetical protein COR50_14250 [Chitinophaga caeni]